MDHISSVNKVDTAQNIVQNGDQVPLAQIRLQRVDKSLQIVLLVVHHEEHLAERLIHQVRHNDVMESCREHILWGLR